MNSTSRIALLALFAIWAGCSPDSSEPEVGMDMPAPATETVPPSAEAPALNDAQIAHIAVTANAIDVEMAELVPTRSTTPEVQEFAETMITDHTAVNEQASALAQRLGVVPEDNDVSRSLQEDAASSRSQLEGLSGGAFDRAYMEREVAYHQAVLDALDQTLIPGASNAELRDLLVQVRPAIVAHLDHAKSLQASLRSDG